MFIIAQMKADGGEAVGFVGPAIRGHWGQATNQVTVIPLSVIIAFWTRTSRGCPCAHDSVGS